jgi:hypothetical protein
MTPGNETNVEPLLVNYVDTWKLRPEAITRIPNFFLASDYVRTHTDLATMEGANEAARRATNGILKASGSSAKPCEIWKLHEPEVLMPLRAYDRQRFRRGLAWDGGVVELAQHALGLAAAATASAGPIDGAESLGAARMSELVRRIHRDSQELVGVSLAQELVKAPPVDSVSQRTAPVDHAPTASPAGYPSPEPGIRILPR